MGFRWSVQFLASELGDIYGRVWNNEDGTVTILAQSEQSEKISQFIQEIRKGPSRMSKVTYLDVQLSNFPDYSDFKVQ
ncbi:acylphosphatase [Streptococcus gallinaceus]|nr:acylphosphatase [Streptococcus gallinaceus]MCP1770617.1 acylphosphatase [Streptococcus gallinaceus]